MSEKLAEIYTTLVTFGIPAEECSKFILSLLGDSNKDCLTRQSFLVKYKNKIEAGTTIFKEGLV